MRHLRGVRGRELAICIALTPVVVLLYVLGWTLSRLDEVRGWVR